MRTCYVQRVHNIVYTLYEPNMLYTIDHPSSLANSIVILHEMKAVACDWEQSYIQDKMFVGVLYTYMCWRSCARVHYTWSIFTVNICTQLFSHVVAWYGLWWLLGNQLPADLWTLTLCSARCELQSHVCSYRTEEIRHREPSWYCTCGSPLELLIKTSGRAQHVYLWCVPPFSSPSELALEDVLTSAHGSTSLCCTINPAIIQAGLIIMAEYEE